MKAAKKSQTAFSAVFLERMIPLIRYEPGLETIARGKSLRAAHAYRCASHIAPCLLPLQIGHAESNEMQGAAEEPLCTLLSQRRALYCCMTGC